MTAHESEAKAELLNSVKTVALEQKLDMKASAQLLAKTLDAQTKVVEQKKKKSTTVSTTKALDVKDYIKTRAFETLDSEDKRAIVHQRRAYIVKRLDEKNAEVFSSTFYYVNNERRHLNTDTSRKIVQSYIARKVKLLDKFKSANIMQFYKTEGSAYGDLVRTALYEISLQVNSDKQELTAELKAKMQSLKKSCIFYDVSSNSRRKLYEFQRVF